MKQKNILSIASLCLIFLVLSCGGEKKSNTMKNQLKTFVLTNKSKSSVTITNFGATVMAITVPDKNGKIGDVVLGYDTPEEYIKGNPYFGAIIGRYGNRISKGKFELDGKTYSLATNVGKNHLHGGNVGFNNVVWEVVDYKNKNDQHFLKLKYLSKDDEEGYPGNLTVFVTYSFTDDNELIIDYEASCDKNTILNLTHHSFFNLKDAGKSDILDHEIKILAGHYLPVSEELLPTGQIQEVAGTPMDFEEFHPIGQRINDPFIQLQYGKGYDHCWVLNKQDNPLSLAAIVREPVSGREMKMFTTEPGMQFYAGNFLDGSDEGKDHTTYNYRSAFCLEAQHFPDSPNHPNFPSTILHPGDTYHQKTIYKFSTFSEEPPHQSDATGGVA